MLVCLKVHLTLGGIPDIFVILLDACMLSVYLSVFLFFVFGNLINFYCKACFCEVLAYVI